MTNNSVVMWQTCGGDISHALAAWQSTGTQYESTDKYIDLEWLYDITQQNKTKSPEELLDMLASSGHFTPFEHSLITFQVTADIATHIQILKHRIGVSVNSESARYKELHTGYYTPYDWPEDLLAELEEMSRLSKQKYHDAVARLRPLLGAKRAKESARYFLMYNHQITFAVTFNFKSLMHFYKLRASEHAQREIAIIADEMISLVKGLPGNPFELSLKAFNV